MPEREPDSRSLAQRIADVHEDVKAIRLAVEHRLIVLRASEELEPDAIARISEELAADTAGYVCVLPNLMEVVSPHSHPSSQLLAPLAEAVSEHLKMSPRVWFKSALAEAEAYATKTLDEWANPRLKEAVALLREFLAAGHLITEPGTTQKWCKHCGAIAVDGKVVHKEDCLRTRAARLLEEGGKQP